MAYRPLADEIRPKTLDEVVGQKHILGKDGLLRRIIEGGDIPNLIFYGPSGTGKTTESWSVPCVNTMKNGIWKMWTVFPE